MKTSSAKLRKMFDIEPRVSWDTRYVLCKVGGVSMFWKDRAGSFEDCSTLKDAYDLFISTEDWSYYNVESHWVKKSNKEILDEINMLLDFFGEDMPIADIDFTRISEENKDPAWIFLTSL